MVIIYYSHARNTERFVHRHLLPELNRVAPSSQRSDGKNVAFRVHSEGPRADIDYFTLPHSNVMNKVGLEDFKIPTNTDVLFVTPTYGKFNHEIHRAENFTPEPMKQVMNYFLNSRHPSDTDFTASVAVGGNRTFGRDFAVQDRIPSGINRVGNFELSGSMTEAKEIIRNYREAKDD